MSKENQNSIGTSKTMQTHIKDAFSCGPIDMKFAPHETCSISIPKPTDQTVCTVKVMWAELRKS